VPEGRLAEAIGAKGINAVVFGGDVNHIVHVLPRNGDVGGIERLGVNLTFHRKTRKLCQTERN